VIIFPWISGLLLLLVIAAAVGSTVTAAISLARERRLHLRRPTVRAMVLLTALELVLFVLWVLTIRVT
jgi:hypothetical protein